MCSSDLRRITPGRTGFYTAANAGNPKKPICLLYTSNLCKNIDKDNPMSMHTDRTNAVIYFWTKINLRDVYKRQSLSSKEAALKLAEDFSVHYDAKGHDPPRRRPVKRKISEDVYKRQA